MFVIACQPEDEAARFGYGPFPTRKDAEEWMRENAIYQIRIGNMPCPYEHDILEIFTAREDGGIG